MYPGNFTPENEGRVQISYSGRSRKGPTLNKPDRRTNPGPYRARIPPFFPGTGTVFPKTGRVSGKSGSFYAGERCQRIEQFGWPRSTGIKWGANWIGKNRGFPESYWFHIGESQYSLNLV
jgi:hypothetical protein